MSCTRTIPKHVAKKAHRKNVDITLCWCFLNKVSYDMSSSTIYSDTSLTVQGLLCALRCTPLMVTRRALHSTAAWDSLLTTLLFWNSWHTRSHSLCKQECASCDRFHNCGLHKVIRWLKTVVEVRSVQQQCLRQLVVVRVADTLARRLVVSIFNQTSPVSSLSYSCSVLYRL